MTSSYDMMFYNYIEDNVYLKFWGVSLLFCYICLLVSDLKKNKKINFFFEKSEKIQKYFSLYVWLCELDSLVTIDEIIYRIGWMNIELRLLKPRP